MTFLFGYFVLSMVELEKDINSLRVGLKEIEKVRPKRTSDPC